jgi:hypothetical protein
LIEKQPYKVEGKRPRPEYVLTEKGRALQPILIALTQWGDDWMGEGQTPPLSFTHAVSRQRVRAAFVDEEGREALPAHMRAALRK